ncbi:MAG: CcoQ/FixQ family Cbb3-type cytochrome c oxidase assembly chaperone [Planctomycetota bacterium]|nr:MAG: CcoQ/FixQ family Cbb3-type cytochrome c oxidase assembly chaperone [Planctomycetota bacterium]RLS99159.1 MAG: CcoQ/FixQ family Cbb3-type cytochrome c oxidase assembly chaperone [Planctomycetota bacterium]
MIRAPLQMLALAGLWPMIALVIFIVLFFAIVAYVFMVPKSSWQRDAELPLDRPTHTPENSEKPHA